jgi:hypothetical protein
VDLSVGENIEFFARLFGQGPAERRWRVAALVKSIELAPFVDRPAKKLSSSGRGRSTRFDCGPDRREGSRYGLRRINDTARASG